MMDEDKGLLHRMKCTRGVWHTIPEGYTMLYPSGT